MLRGVSRCNGCMENGFVEKHLSMTSQERYDIYDLRGRVKMHLFAHLI